MSIFGRLSQFFRSDSADALSTIDLDELDRVRLEAAAWCRRTSRSRALSSERGGAPELGASLAGLDDICWPRLRDVIQRRRRVLDETKTELVDRRDRLLIRFFERNADYQHIGTVAPQYFAEEYDIQLFDTWVWLAERPHDRFPNLISLVLREDVECVNDALESNPDDSFQWLDQIDDELAKGECVPRSLIEYAARVWTAE